MKYQAHQVLNIPVQSVRRVHQFQKFPAVGVRVHKTVGVQYKQVPHNVQQPVLQSGLNYNCSCYIRADRWERHNLYKHIPHL